MKKLATQSNFPTQPEAATETTVSLGNTAAKDDEAMRSATKKALPDALNTISRQLESCNEEELKAIFKNSPQTLNDIASATSYRHLQIVDYLLAKVAEDDDGRTALMVAAGDRSNDALRLAASMDNLGFWSQNSRRVAENTTASMDEPVEHTENSSVPAID